MGDKIETKERQELEELIELLGSIKGRHTELVSVLIPSGANVNATTRQLEGEKSTASNIKSTATRKNVIAALEMIIRELKLIKETPKNGLAIYAGNISEKEGQQDIQIWMYEPPRALNVKLYRCDQEFVIEPLEEMAGIEEVFGLLVIDRQQAMIGLLEGKRIKVLQKLTSGVPGKVRAGGQCLSSDSLIMKDNGRLIKLENIKVGTMIQAFSKAKNKVKYTKCLRIWNKEDKKILEIKTKKRTIISSPEHKFFLYKNKVIIEKEAIDLILGDKLIDSKLNEDPIVRINNSKGNMDMFDIETECGNFFANGVLVHNSSQRFHRITEGLAKDFFRRVAEEMKKNFFDMDKLKGILVGGPIPTKEDFLDEGQLVTKLKEKIIAVKDIGYVDEHGLELLVEESQGDIAEQELIKEKEIIERFFDTLGKKRSLAAYGEKDVRVALERGAVNVLLISKNLDKSKTKEFEKLAENIGSQVIIISHENQDGEQFWNLTKGIGAILRFALE